MNIWQTIGVAIFRAAFGAVMNAVSAAFRVALSNYLCELKKQAALTDNPNDDVAVNALLTLLKIECK